MNRPIKNILVVFLRFSLLLGFLPFPGVGQAKSLTHDVSQALSGLGVANNITQASAYNGQQAGFMTGGSFYARTGVRRISPAQINMPSFRGGCSIDLFAGGFSFINAKQLRAMFMQIMNHAVAYSFTLGIDTISPQMGNVIHKMETLANSVNQTNYSTCHIAQGLVGMAWPKEQATQALICEQVGMEKDIFTDWADARQQCSQIRAGGDDPTKFASDEQKRTSQYEALNPTGNLAWKALAKAGFDTSASGGQLAEMLMSLSGTVIVHDAGKGDTPQPIQTLPSVLTASMSKGDDPIHSLLYGGKFPMYQCTDFNSDQCDVVPSEAVTVTIDKDHALVGKVSAELVDLLDKIRTDAEPTDEEKALISNTRLPVLRFLTVAAAREGNAVSVDRYAEAVALDMVENYVSTALNTVKAATRSLDWPERDMKKFNAGIADAEARLRNLYNRQKIGNATLAQMTQETQTLEQNLQSIATQNFNAPFEGEES